MKSLPPIPTPLALRWREFRIKFFPGVAVLAALLACVQLWVRHVSPPALIGEVEPIRANVMSVVPGTLQALKAELFQQVTNGQELAELALVEPDQLEGELAALAATLRVTKAQLDVNRARSMDAYSTLRLNLLNAKVTLELSRIRLRQADAELQRVSQLYEQKLVPRGVESAPAGFGARNELGYDVAQRDRDALRAQVETETLKVAQLEQDVKQMEATGTAAVPATEPIIEAAIQAEQTRLERLQRPVLLRSPIDGFISAVLHQPGEKVPAGQAILVVSANKSDRILAWVRQPVTVRPEVGDRVVMRRGWVSHLAVECTVTEVGRHLEPIDPAALPRTTLPNRVELGLPLLVKAPLGVDLIPGETIGLTFKSRPRWRELP